MSLQRLRRSASWRQHCFFLFVVVYVVYLIAAQHHNAIFYLRKAAWKEQSNSMESGNVINNDQPDATSSSAKTEDTAAPMKPLLFEETRTGTDPLKVEENSGPEYGVLSQKDPLFFRQLQQKVDNYDNSLRCQRYGFRYDAKQQPANRRIFHGTMTADEPWELFEIVAAEVYGIFAAMVFVEGNRTQTFAPRAFRRLGREATLRQMFGVEAIQMRPYVDEDPAVRGFTREDNHRAQIIQGWRELGMGPDDVGLLSDADETFTRDFLRAVQVCDGIDVLNYDLHHCEHSNVKLYADTRVFESSPECITADRSWYHPDIIIGHCVEGIGDEDKHPPAPRIPGSYRRAEGFGHKGWGEEQKITDNRYPAWNFADFRGTIGGRPVSTHNVKASSQALGFQPDRYTAFHFHNFFAQFNSTRFKYKTYGHSNPRAYEQRIEEMNNDLKMMYRCVKDLKEDQDQKWKRVVGGFENINPFYPIYFQDEDYRRRRHAFVIDMVEADDNLIGSTRRR